MSQTDTNNTPRFNPNEHTIQLKTKEGYKDYLPVQWRLVWFREQCPQGIIQTKLIHLDTAMDTEEEGYAWNEEKRKSEKMMKHAKGFAVFHAHVQDGKGGEAEGTKSEKAASFADYIEKAETGAIGRALAALGYGTQFAPDFEGDMPANPVDSPVHHASGNSEQTQTGAIDQQTATNIKAKIDALLAEFATLFPNAAKKPDWQNSLAQRVWGEVPEAYTLDHYRRLNAYYLEQKASGKTARVHAM